MNVASSAPHGTPSSSHDDAVRAPSIINPWVDALCVGGGSILLLVPLLLFSEGKALALPLQLQAAATVVLNLPHFLASYRIIYGSRKMAAQHPWATRYVPLALLAYGIFAVVTAKVQPIWITGMIVVAGVYLARHYTGQAWGMMAAFAHLHSRPFTDSERRLIRAGFNLLLAWHVAWFFYNFPMEAGLRDVMEPIYSALCLASILAIGLGATGLALHVRRTRRLPPLETLVAWVAIYLWYAALANDARTLFWIQIAHSIQYLIFPIRMELNKVIHGSITPFPAVVVRRRMIGYGVWLLAGSALIGYLIPNTGGQWLSEALDDDHIKAASVALFAFINIHHFFVDGCIWKLRQPEVREALFAHVRK